MYSLTLSQTATVTVVFGKTTSYGLRTSAQQTPAGGGHFGILVAGMQANTTYHMQAQVQLSDGRMAFDSDRTFTTGSYPAGLLPT